jgi:hypothetical protein
VGAQGAIKQKPDNRDDDLLGAKRYQWPFCVPGEQVEQSKRLRESPFKNNRWGAFPGQETNLWFVDSYVANSNWITRFSGSIYLVALWDESLASSNRDECLEHGSGEEVIV